VQPAWISLALTGIIALLGFAGMFFGLKYRTDQTAEATKTMALKQESEEHKLNELMSLFREAMAKQLALNEMVLKGLESAVAKLETLEARVQTNESALMLITNRWPEILEWAREHK
jgi:hypothetical protein